MQKKKTKIPELLARAFEVNSDAVIISDRHGTIEYTNHGFTKIFGYGPEEVLGENLNILMPEPYTSEHAQYIQRYLDTGIPHIIGIGREARAQKKNGDIFPIHISVGEFAFESESFFLGILVDLTRQKAIETTLLLSEERATLAQRFAGIGYWDWTIATGDLYWSEQIAPMFGHEIGTLETSYKNFLNAIHPDDRKAVEEAVNNSVTKGDPYEIEHRVVWPDKTVRWLLERGNVTRNQNDEPIRMLGVVQDITNRKELETQLITAKEEAEAGAKTKATFLANMSHEIRTPLNSIIGFIELSLDDQTLPPHIKSHLQTANISAKSLLHLLNDILDISKLEAGKLEPIIELFYLPRFLMETTETMAIRAKEKALDLQLHIDPKLQNCIYSDSSRLRQILVNLIGNAIKFTEKGSVLISVSLTPESELLFIIKDTGIGMHAKEVKKLFEPFTQADPSTARQYGGTGLGTTISKQLVELLQGKIWAESEPGKGTTLYFTIPYHAPECATECDIECEEHTITPKGHVATLTRAYRFLLAEDIVENAELTRVRLERQGSFVDIAHNGQEAVNLFQKNRYDIILMDIQMPILDGLAATRKIREIESKNEGKYENGNHIPVIALTASVLREEQNNCFKAGIDYIVTKPINFGSLFALIEKVMKDRAKAIPFLSPLPQNSLPDEKIIWPESACIDIAKGLANWQVARAYANSLVNFSKKYKDASGQIENFIRNRRFDEAARLTHALKGLTGNLAITKLKELLSEANSFLKEKNAKEALELMPEIQTEFTQTLKCIAQIKFPAKEAPQKKEPPPSSELIPEIDDLMRRFNRGEYTPEIIDHILEKLESFCEPALLDTLHHSIEEFHFADANIILTKVKAQISNLEQKK